MKQPSYRRHRFPPEIIQLAVWLYFRFPLSFRDVEDLLAERGIDISYETVRLWSLKFGQVYAAKLRRARPTPDTCWHLDEVFVLINGKRMYLWRAVDSEGETHHCLAQQQPSGKFTPAGQVEGATNAALQVGWICTEISFNPRRRIQYLQRPTPSHLPQDTSKVPQRGNGYVAVSGGCRLIEECASVSCG